MDFISNMGMAQRLGAAGVVVMLLVLLLMKQRQAGGTKPASAKATKGKNSSAKSGKSLRGKKAKSPSAATRRRGGRLGRKKKSDDIDEMPTPTAVGRMVPRLPSAGDGEQDAFASALGPLPDEMNGSGGSQINEPGWPTAGTEQWASTPVADQGDQVDQEALLPIDATQPIESADDAMALPMDDSGWATTEGADDFDPATGWNEDGSDPAAQPAADEAIDWTTDETPAWTTEDDSTGWQTGEDADAISTWTNSDATDGETGADWTPVAEETATVDEPMQWEPVDEPDVVMQDETSIDEVPSFTDWGTGEDAQVTPSIDADSTTWTSSSDEPRDDPMPDSPPNSWGEVVDETIEDAPIAQMETFSWDTTAADSDPVEASEVPVAVGTNVALDGAVTDVASQPVVQFPDMPAAPVVAETSTSPAPDTSVIDIFAGISNHAPIENATILPFDPPAPVMEAPAPVVETPAPVVETPAPVMDAPAPLVEAPAPVVEAPAPVMDADAIGRPRSSMVMAAPIINPLDRWAGLSPAHEPAKPAVRPVESWARMSPRITARVGSLVDATGGTPTATAVVAAPRDVGHEPTSATSTVATEAVQGANAWWDVPESSQHNPRRGRFALGGYALQAGHQVVSGVTFREGVVPPPDHWVIGPVTGSIAPGTLVLDVDGCLNCRAEDLAVLMEAGFAPTTDGFSLRLCAERQGPFAASGTYVIY